MIYGNGSITEQSNRRSEDARDAAELRQLKKEMEAKMLADNSRVEGQNEALMAIQAAADREAGFNNTPISQSAFAQSARVGEQDPSLYDSIRSKVSSMFASDPAPAQYQERALAQEQELADYQRQLAFEDALQKGEVR